MTWQESDVVMHELTEVDYRVINAMAANQKAIGLHSLIKQDYRSGVTGEYLFAKRFPEALKSKKENVYLYDFNVNGHLVDVKTRTLNVPKIVGSYSAWVLDYIRKHIKANYLYFCATNLDRNLAYEVAYMETERFFNEATFIKKGTMEEPMHYVARQDQYRMTFDKMNPISELTTILNNPAVEG